MKTFGFKVYGKVQQVGFRKFVLGLAQKYGIKGWVRNNLDGCVEAVCSAEEKVFFDFLREVNGGSVKSEVQGISFFPLQIQSFEEFVIAESERE